MKKMISYVLTLLMIVTIGYSSVFAIQSGASGPVIAGSPEQEAPPTAAPKGADENDPKPRTITTYVGRKPAAQDGVNNMDQLTRVKSVVFKDENEIDVSKPINKEITILVIYDDNSQDEVLTTLIVKELRIDKLESEMGKSDLVKKSEAYKKADKALKDAYEEAYQQASIILSDTSSVDQEAVVSAYNELAKARKAIISDEDLKKEEEARKGKLIKPIKAYPVIVEAEISIGGSNEGEITTPSKFAVYVQLGDQAETNRKLDISVSSGGEEKIFLKGLPYDGVNLGGELKPEDIAKLPQGKYSLVVKDTGESISEPIDLDVVLKTENAERAFLVYQDRLKEIKDDSGVKVAKGELDKLIENGIPGTGENPPIVTGAATVIKAKDGVNQVELDEAASKLWKSVVKALAPVDKEGLKAEVAKSGDIKKSDKYIYSEESLKKAYDNAVVKAQQAIDDSNADAAKVKEALEELKQAGANLNGVKPLMYTITTDAVNGAISGNKTVKAGDDVEIRYTPKEGFELGKLIVDGREESITSDNMTMYRFTNVDKDHSIKVEFKKIIKPTPLTPAEPIGREPEKGPNKDPQEKPNVDPNKDPNKELKKEPKLGDSTKLNEGNAIVKDNQGNYLFTKGRSKGLKLRFEGVDLKDFKALLLDNNSLTENKDFTVSQGSIIVDIKTATLENLVDGNYTITLVTKDDLKAKAKVAIKTASVEKQGKKDNSNSGKIDQRKDSSKEPVKTGDDSMMRAYGMLAVTLAGVMYFVVRRRKNI